MTVDGRKRNGRFGKERGRFTETCKHAHDFATNARQDIRMTGKRILAITAYSVFTAACVALLALLWVSANLLNFPCDSPEDPRPCAEVVPWFFATRGLLPIGGAWALVTWAIFRRRNKR